MSEREVRKLQAEWDLCKLPLKVYNHMRERFGLSQARAEDLSRVGMPAEASSTTFRDLSAEEAAAGVASLKLNDLDASVIEQGNGLFMLSVPAQDIILRAGRKLVTINSKCGKWAVVGRLNCETGAFTWLNPGDAVKLEETEVEAFREARECSLCDHDRGRKYLWVVIRLDTYKFETLGTTCAVKEFGLDLNVIFGREVKKATRSETERVLDDMALAVSIEHNRDHIERTHAALDVVLNVPLADVMAELERIVKEEGVQNDYAHNTLAALRERPWRMFDIEPGSYDTFLVPEHLSRWGQSVRKISYRLMKQAEAADPNAPPPEEIEVPHADGDRVDLEVVYTKRLLDKWGEIRHFFTDANGVKWSFKSSAVELDVPRTEVERATQFEVGDRVSVRVTIGKIAKDIVWCRMPKCFRILKKSAVEVAA